MPPGGPHLDTRRRRFNATICRSDFRSFPNLMGKSTKKIVPATKTTVTKKNDLHFVVRLTSSS